MSDISDELIEIAKRVINLGQAENGDSMVPPPPEYPAGAEKELAQIYYKGLIDEAGARVKAAMDAQAVALKLEEDRANTKRANDFESQKAGTAADVDRAKAATAADLEREKAATAVEAARRVAAQAFVDGRRNADAAAEVALVKSVHDAYLTVAQSAIDRSLKRAEFLATAVTALTGIYTALLGVTYGLQAGNTPLPARGIIPGIFLGVSLVFAALYMAFIRGYDKPLQLFPSGIGGDQLTQKRVVTFLSWTFAGVLRRAWALRMSVISLAVALALLPIPFVDVSSAALVWVVGVAAGIILLAAVIEGVYWVVQSKRESPGGEVPGPVPGPLAARPG